MPFNKRKEQFLYTRCERLIPYLWPLVLGILIVLGSASYQNYRWHKSRVIEQQQRALSQSALHGLSLLDSMFKQYAQQIEDSVRLLAEGGRLNEFARSGSAHARATIEQQWMLLAENSGRYTQIRYVDTNGQELIRVNFNPETGRSSVARSLQNKSHRPYMKLAGTLADHEVAIAAFDLETEFGRLVNPYTIAGRVISPVTVGQVRTGYVLMNMQMHEMFNFLDRHQSLSQSNLEVLTVNGHYIRSQDPNRAFGHLLPSRTKWQLSHTQPDLWQKLSQSESGVVPHGDGLVAYRWLPLNTSNRRIAADSKRILLINNISNEMILGASNDALNAADNSWKLRSIVILGISLLGGFGLQRWLTSFKTQRLMLNAVSRMSAVILTNEDGEVIGVNRAFVDVTGFQPNEVIGLKAAVLRPLGNAKQAYRDMQHTLMEEGKWQGEMQSICKDGRVIHVWLETNAIWSERQKNKIDYYVSNFVDITERKQLESKLHKLSITDPLTGAYNRRRFDEEIERLVKLNRRYPENGFSLALIDIDGFKPINDNFGHDMGDQMLQAFVNLLKGTLRDTDFLARLGGDEFAVLFPNTDQEDAIAVMERICRQVAMTFTNPVMTCSVGVVQSTGALLDNELCAHADAALYQSKALGRNRVMCSVAEDSYLESEENLPQTS